MCEDLRPKCGNFKPLCNNTTFELIMKQDCPRTCGQCKPKIIDKEFMLLPNIETNSKDFKAVSASSLSKTIIKGM